MKQYSMLIALVCLFVVMAFLTDGGFLHARNLTNLARQISINGVLAVGMTMVIITGGIDLSVGSVVALSGIIAGYTQVSLGLSDWGAWGAFLSFAACIGTGLLCGTINGGLVAKFKIPPFIITLGMMVMARGVALIVSDSSAISPMSAEFKWIAKGYITPELTLFVGIAVFLTFIGIQIRRLKDKPLNILTFVITGVSIIAPFWAFYSDRGIPLPAFYLAIVAMVGFALLKFFPFGRYLYAMGSNEEAAYLAGIKVVKMKWWVYGLIGACAGLAGTILTSRLNSASPSEGQLMELDAIAAVVIGGTSLMGGSGTILGTMIGVFLIGTLNNGMDLLGIDSNIQMVIKGMIIILAVWSDSRGKKARGS